MTIRSERIVLDTNVWIFGLRRVPAYPACAQVIDRLDELLVVIPRQVLRELQVNLDEGEPRTLFQVVNRHREQIMLDWQSAPIELIGKFRALGCSRGDAVVAAHVEHLGVPVLVSENRDLLAGKSGLPFRILTASAAITELEQTDGRP